MSEWRLFSASENFFSWRKRLREGNGSHYFEARDNLHGRFVELSSLKDGRTKYIMIPKGVVVIGWKRFHSLFEDLMGS